MKKSITFSIITSTLNSEQYLKRCILSVKNQTFKSVEHIIVDGLSTDRTNEIVNQLKYPGLSFHEESKKGIYPAWNKGIKLAKGSWILFLGSDDFLLNDTCLAKVYKRIRLSETESSFLSCGIIKGDPVELDKKQPLRLFKNDIKDSIYDGPTLVMPPYPALFHSYALFKKGKKFDESYKAAADKKFFLDNLGTASIQFMDIGVTYFSTGGITARDGNKFQMWREKNRMRKVCYSK